MNDRNVTLTQELYLVGIETEDVLRQLEDLIAVFPNPVIRVQERDCKAVVSLTASGEDEEVCEVAISSVSREIRERLGQYIYSAGGTSLEATVLSLLRQRGLTLAAAESCTGGLVAKRLTDVPGASDCFAGGVVVYTEATKCALLGLEQSFIDEHGVVSAAVADKLARRVRKKIRSDLGVGITGWAGPGGEDVGLVYVALAWKNTEGMTMSCVRRLTLGDRDRETVRAIAADNALDMVRRYCSGLEI